MSVERPIRRLDLRAYQHATEDRDRVVLALRFVAGDGEPAARQAEGYHGNPITVWEVSVSGRAGMEGFWARLADAGLCAGLSENLEERISEDGELFVRFDKQQAVGGRLALSPGDDVISARGRVLATVKGQEARADRDIAVEVMRAFLRELEKKKAQGAGRDRR